MHPHPAPRRLGRVSRTDPLLRRTDTLPAELYLLEAIDDLMKVEDDMGAIGDEEPPGTVETYVYKPSFPNQSKFFFPQLGRDV